METKNNIADSLFFVHEKMVKNIANTLSTLTSEDFDDLYQEGYLAFQKGFKKYESKKSIWTSYIWNIIRFHMMDYIRKKKHIDKIISQVDMDAVSDCDPFFDVLTKDAIYIVSNLNEFNQELDMTSERDADQLMINKMVEIGWSRIRAEIAVAEIHLALNQVN